VRWATFLRGLMRLCLGRRLPIVDGDINVPELTAEVHIRRDRWGVPHISAASEDDAWFGLGFCHGQDRAFQLESMLRVGRGTLSERIGRKGIPVDRLCRRIGFYHSAQQQVAAQTPAAQRTLERYAGGINAGVERGLANLPHEFVFLGGRPTPWTAADVLAFVKVLSFLLVANWDSELVRLRMVQADGADAAFALDPLSQPRSRAACVAGMENLRDELAALAQVIGSTGGSNNWAISHKRTVTGRPIVANDPHLFPALPSQWYLAHLKTPEWEAAGATLVGSPGIVSGHNGHAAWAVTAGLVDNTDLFIEGVGRDGRTVREPNGFQPCTVRQETIVVKGAAPIVEEVLVTPRGPIISPALSSAIPALSLRAVWLDPLPARGLMQVHRCKNLNEFRDCFREWPLMSLNMVYADVDNHIAWQLVGEAPTRKCGFGLTPQPGWLPSTGWESFRVPFDQMPHAIDPIVGFVASANNHPDPHGNGPYLGCDFLDPHRYDAIVENLETRNDWSVKDIQSLHLNVQSMPWRTMREVVLRNVPAELEGIRAWEVLRDWDGHVRAESAGAAVYQLVVVDLMNRLAKAKSPNGHAWALGRREATPGNNLFYCRRTQHLAALLGVQPPGWCDDWNELVKTSITKAGRFLFTRYGEKTDRWRWGDLRRLTLRHTLLQNVSIIRSIFNEGPFPIGGDADTIMQAAVSLTDVTADTDNIPGMRHVIDVGNWSESRFVLAGGQSGNPLSSHFVDMVPLWQRGEGVPIPWTEAEVQAAAVHELRLKPQSSA